MPSRNIDRLKFWISWIFKALLVLAGGIAVFTGDWINLALAVFTLFLTFLPSIINKRLQLDLPTEFEIIILLFIFLSLYLGEIQLFYRRLWWWDIFMHSVSGVIIAIFGFALVYSLNKQKPLKLSSGFVAMFAFSFSLALGASWEIFEFFMDSVWGINMQKSGLVDTMWDLIVDAMGAMAVSLLGYLYLKNGRRPYKRVVERFRTH